MISKEELIEYSVANFTQFGSKRYSMDELASSLGISKKTIYKCFGSKEALVIACVQYLIEAYKSDIKDSIKSEEVDPITNIIIFYKKAFEHLQYYKPSFIFGLQKYYPKANLIFDDFRNEFVNEIIFSLLQKAQEQGILLPKVNVQLFCDLYFKRFEEIAFKNSNLIEKYSQADLLNHFIIFNLRGITTPEYQNPYFN